MNLTVKTLKGTHFQIHVQPTDSVMAVKQKIEESQGKESYPWAQQLLIHSGKVLKDDTTLADNEIGENGFLVVMLSKNKTPQSASGASSAPPSKSSVTAGASSASQPAGTTAVSPSEVPPQAPAGENTVPSSDRATPEIPVYDQAASNLVSGSTLEPIVQQLMDMGGGNWDKDTVQRALRAAYNNPERAVEYLYSGIPETAARTTQMQGVNMDEAALAGATFSGIPNSAPLNMFPQGIPSLGAGVGGGSLDFLRNNPQFQTLRAMVQANPQILQPMLQELSKQNPQLLRLIQEHNSEFLQLINEPVEGLEGDMFDDQADEEMAHSISVTPAEQEAIERLEAMGFDRANVIEAFLACDRNEELAANYLLEHAADED